MSQRYCHGDKLSPNPYRSTSGIRSVMSFKKTKNKKTHPIRRLRHQPTSIKVNRYKKQKGTTYAKPWEGTDAFLAPWKQKNCQKSQPEVFSFKDGVVRQKSAHKNFIKKVVVWGFLSAMREKREGNGKKPWRNACAFVRVCVCEHTNVCKWGLSLRHLDFSGWANNSWEGKQNWDVWLGKYRQGRRRGQVRLGSSPLLCSKGKEKQKKK